MLVAIIGFAVLAVDVSSLYSAQAEIQRSADASALAAASALVSGGGDNSLAIQRADEMARANSVMLVSAGLDGQNDVEFGSATPTGTGRFTFSPGGSPVDAVRVTVRRTEGSSGGPISLGFARIFGVATRGLTARATASLIPRDIALVVDLSGSMAWDSSLLLWNRTDGGSANTRDCWAALDGPEPSRPYLPGAEDQTEYAGDIGPAIGWMNTWGSPLTPGVYSVASDAGLWQIRKGVVSAVPVQVITNLTAAGYSADERSVITSPSRDTNAGHWQRRCGVMLGLASWRSGRVGGIPGGNGDAVLDNAEVSWAAYPSWRGTWTWTNYVDYVQGNNWANDSSIFRYRYGLKSFMHFLLDNRRAYAQTPGLWATPELPLRAIKDATQSMVDVLVSQQTMDHLSLEVFATTARHELGLTGDFQSIANTLYARQAGHYDPTTNIGGGLAQAITELQSARARDNAKKVIILLSDGVPNIDESGNYVGDGAASAMNYCRTKAQEAANLGFTVHTISVGSYADRGIMQEIATIGGGIEFYAAGNPDEYTQQLQDIFRSLGGQRPVQLIE
ncbi:MAG: VWA domain-containing protein [Planctomycetes bacterium]|nr:VWA domain-containing protein [Planctomycetota bacterium]